MDFTSLPPSIINDLYEEAKLEVLTFDDFLNLPLNDLYLKENGNDPATFAKYKPKVEDVPIVIVEEIVESKPETIEHEDTRICKYCLPTNDKTCKYCLSSQK